MQWKFLGEDIVEKQYLGCYFVGPKMKILKEYQLPLSGLKNCLLLGFFFTNMNWPVADSLGSEESWLAASNQRQ